VEQQNESEMDSIDVSQTTDHQFIGSKFTFKQRQDSLNVDDDLLVGSHNSADQDSLDEDLSLSSMNMDSHNSSQASNYI